MKLEFMGLRSMISRKSISLASFLCKHSNKITVIITLPRVRVLRRLLASQHREPSYQTHRLSHNHSQPNCLTMAGAMTITKRGAGLEIIKFSETTSTNNGINEAFSSVISSSASCLLKGGVIGVPTDTIYGIACLAQNTEAVNRIYEIKHRNRGNPVAISVGTIDDIYRWSKVTVSRDILVDLLPGPVTVVFERSSELNPALNPGTELVGIRIPNHTFMQSLARECNGPIALTSANISGGSSCLQVEEFESLWPRLDLIVNGGKLSDTEESRLGSTVVDLSVRETFRIIRPGSAHKATLNCLHSKHKLREITSAPSSR